MRITPFILLPSLGLLSLVACNEAPSAPTIALQPGEPTTTDDLVVEFLSLSTDGDAKDEVTHRFTWFVDGDARDDLMTDTVRAGETTKGQTWKVVVIPNDGDVDGPAAEASVTILNTLPVAAMDLAPGVPATDDDLVVTASATDADDDAVTFTYTWTRDGQATEYAGATLPADATAHGETWTVTATPNDGEADGPPVTASVTITNTAPALASVTIVPELPFANETIVAVVDGITDADADSVALTYRWRVNGTIVQEGPDAELAPGTFAKHDGVTVEVVPNDGFVDGPSVTSDAALVQNSVPAGLSASVTPGEAYEATTLACVPTGWSDADGDPEGWTFTWEVNGTPISTDATLTGASFSKADVVACRAVPFDGEESGAELVASAITVRNTLPVLAGATLSTTAPREADTISVTLGAATDDDGDTVTYGYVWSVNGSTVATTPTLTGARFGKGDRISVTVTPYDGTTAGTPVTTSEAVGANSPPVLGTATVTPGTLRTNDEAVANVSASDPDGDTVTRSYAWTVNGIPVASAASTLDGAVWFDKGQTVQVTVTPDDGADIGAASSSASVTVANSAPTTPVVSIDPMDPSTSDDLVCGIDTASVDPDGDTVSYAFAWDRDGSAYAGATRTLYTSDTVPASATSDAETWTCEVVAGDGVDESGVGSAGVTTTPATCGNGVLDATEACDDGNSAVGDGCSASCQLSCELPPAATVLLHDPMDTTTGWIGPSCMTGASPTLIAGGESSVAWDWSGANWGQRRRTLPGTTSLPVVVEYFQRIDSVVSYGSYVRIGVYSGCNGFAGDVFTPVAGVDFGGSGVIDVYGADAHERVAYTPTVGAWERVRVFLSAHQQVACVDDMPLVVASHDLSALALTDFEFGFWHDGRGNPGALDELFIYQ